MSKFDQLSDFEQKSIERMQAAVMSGKLSNAGLVQIIEQAGSFLNLTTPSQYAKENSMSYNGVKHHRVIINLFGCKFVIDNN